MFIHHGSERTFEHNLKIATLLSFVAGMVNVVGFISVHILTTNVTGHFAFFVDDLLELKVSEAIITFLYVFMFFAGAFTSSFLIEMAAKRKKRNIFMTPVILEISILLALGATGTGFYLQKPDLIALGLLFAMGAQNSLVTKISNAVVRTTHLTGLFTDLGIEISQLFFHKSAEQKNKLLSTIRLRTRIILFFLFGGLMGGLLYPQLKLYALLAPALLLISGLLYDNAKFKAGQQK